MKIFIYHATAGHGHRQVAETVEKTLHERGMNENEVRLYDVLDHTPFPFHIVYPEVYYRSVKHTPKMWGWFYNTSDHPWVYSCVRPIRHLANAWAGNRILNEVLKEKPDVIVSTHFLSAQLFSEARSTGRLPSTKVVVVVTDFMPHTFWIHPGTDHYWIMGEEGKKELIRRGVPAEKITAGGIPVAKEFQPWGRKTEMREKHGLEKDRFTILMTSGSFGLGKHADFLKALEPFSDKLQAIVVCGNNKEGQAALEKMTFKFPVRVLGFIKYMPELMEAADLLIAKSGGATTTEALAKGLPMVVTEPIPGQETRNAQILKSRNAAFFLERPSEIYLIAKAIFENPKLLEDKKKEIARLAKPHAAEDLANFILKN